MSLRTSFSTCALGPQDLSLRCFTLGIHWCPAPALRAFPSRRAAQLKKPSLPCALSDPTSCPSRKPLTRYRAPAPVPRLLLGRSRFSRFSSLLRALTLDSHVGSAPSLNLLPLALPAPDSLHLQLQGWLTVLGSYSSLSWIIPVNFPIRHVPGFSRFSSPNYLYFFTFSR